MKIISFSLWGTHPKYLHGALQNAQLAQQIYPGWKCRYYTATSVPAAVIDTLRRMDNVEIVAMGRPGNWESLFWRFLPAAEAEVEAFISRDTDSRLSLRERAAVEDWMRSPHGFHIMRDHPEHYLLGNARIILGGMWGAKTGCLPDIRSLIDGFKKANRYQTDQDFLNSLVAPRAHGNAVVHDEFFEQKPFPTARNGLEFVGQVFDEHETPNPGFEAILGRALHQPHAPVPKVSIIASLYRGGEFIEGFLGNIVRQSVFSQCELIIVDCDPLDTEKTLIQEYRRRYPNIIYKRISPDPGIFGAWNIAVACASGTYITNANVDDRRDPMHIEVHARYLNDFPDVDLVYAQSYMTSVPNERYELSAEHNYLSSWQRVFKRQNMNACLPGCCPLWRKNLHERFGLFDESYRHLGDFEMWLRAVSRGAVFMKIPGVYSVYYENPQGKSNSPQFARERQIETERNFARYGNIFLKRHILGGIYRRIIASSVGKRYPNAINGFKSFLKRRFDV